MTDTTHAIGPAEFVGERDRPMRLESVFCKSPIAAAAAAPPELLQLGSRQSTYKSRQEPSGPIYVQSASLEKPSFFLSSVDRNMGFASNRPSWASATFAPTIGNKPHHTVMRRFDGRRVNPLHVFGSDDRTIIRSSDWPWGLVGKLSTSTGSTGTAALIGKNMLITAGHMVPWQSSEPWWMRFVPASYDGVSLHGNGVGSYVTEAYGYDPGPHVVGYDWAILKLAEPLGEWLGYFGFNGYDNEWEHDPRWVTMGYPWTVAYGTRPSIQVDVSIVDDESDNNGGVELETYADLTEGNSGGPLFGFWPKLENGVPSVEPRIIGVVSGGQESWIDRNNVIAGGPGFSNLIQWGRTNW